VQINRRLKRHLSVHWKLFLIWKRHTPAGLGFYGVCTSNQNSSGVISKWKLLKSSLRLLVLAKALAVRRLSTNSWGSEPSIFACVQQRSVACTEATWQSWRVLSWGERSSDVPLCTNLMSWPAGTMTTDRRWAVCGTVTENHTGMSSGTSVIGLFSRGLLEKSYHHLSLQYMGHLFWWPKQTILVFILIAWGIFSSAPTACIWVRIE